jgi:hypothetical protein
VSVIAFDGRATVALPVSNVPGVALRYTTDGTDPGPRSTEYRRPIVLKKSAEIRAGWFGSKGRMGDMASVRAVRRASTVTAGVPGLSFRQFNVRVDKMPDFGSLGEDASGVQAVPAIEPLDPRRPFVVEWRGLITIDRDGLYTFTVGSDDGSLLWIYDTPVVRNDGLHGYIERSGAAWLTRGTHPIRIGYFNAMGDRGFKAWIEGPGLARQSLAGAMLTHQ